MEPLRIGLAGLGTVGGGVVNLITKSSVLIAQRAGQPIQITAASARDLSKARDLPLEGVRIVPDARSLCTDAGVDVVVEVIGGAEGIAREVVEGALKAGKPVVTANKALLAKHGQELQRLSEKHNATLLWEAAVAGGVPVIKGLREGLAANNIEQVVGILNGTCNYILTTMSATGRDFADVLAEAQKLGYAEADPSFDIDGIDTAHKLALLAALAFGAPPDLGSIRTEGIRHISALDIRFAAELGFVIKLLAVAQTREGGLEQRVQPCMVPANSPLGSIGGPFNAMQAKGDIADRIVWSGRGAGAQPTASAVVADLIDLARGNRPAVFGLPSAQLKALPALAPSVCAGSYYVRLIVKDQPGVIADVAAILRDFNVSMESFLQHGHNPGEVVAVVFTTHETTESAMLDSLRRIGQLSSVAEPPRWLRVLDDL
jgi:homoserine dehydrogenase